MNLKFFIFKAKKAGRVGFAYGLALTLLGILYTFKLSTLVNGANSQEILAREAAFRLKDILYDPVEIGYKLVQHTLTFLHIDSLLTLRLVSVAFALVTIGLFYYVLRNWHTRRLAFLGTILCGSSAWLLHAGRDATPLIALTAVVLLLAFGVWLKSTNRPSLALLAGSLLFGYLLYIPGFIWVLAALLVWQRKTIVKYLKEARLTIAILSCLVLLASLFPLIWAIGHNHLAIKILMGLPAEGYPSVIGYLKDLLLIPVRLFIRGPYEPTHWAGRMPLVDIFTASMVGIGLYAYFHKRRLLRTKLLVGSAILLSLLVALGGSIDIIVLLPIIYIFATAGMTLLLQQWFTVFPRNPFARTLGASLLTTVILIACFYNISAYFIAWPNAQPTKQIYNGRYLLQ